MNEPEPRSWPSCALALAREVTVIAAMLLAVQVGLVQAYHVPTGSMEGTVRPGEWLLVDKVTLGARTPDWLGIPWTDLGRPVPALKLPGLRQVEAGDVVVLRTPVDERTPYVKRVIAVGGQVVEIRDKQVYVDGQLQAAPERSQHVDPRVRPAGLHERDAFAGLGNRDNWGPYRVPADQLFVLGDNRDRSLDSRYFGAIPADDVIGVARLVYFSWDGSDELAPWQRLRWRRLGTLLH